MSVADDSDRGARDRGHEREELEADVGQRRDQARRLVVVGAQLVVRIAHRALLRVGGAAASAERTPRGRRGQALQARARLSPRPEPVSRQGRPKLESGSLDTPYGLTSADACMQAAS